MFTITESTINHILSKIFSDYGFNQLPQIKIAHQKQPDHLIEYKGIRIISETEIGDFTKKLNESLAQLYNYNSALNWNNIIAIVFPDAIRKSIPVEDSDKAFLDILRRTKINAFYSLKDKKHGIYNQGNIFDFMKELIKILDSYYEKPEVDFNILVSALRSSIEELSFTLRNLSLGDQIFETPVGSFDLFTAIAEKDKSDLITSAIDLASYILINQLLFYRIFADNRPELPPLREIKDISELRLRYDKIQQIDFKAIYSIDILSILPKSSIIINEINQIIQILNNLPFNLIQHDILGRIFHDLLPYNTRKMLAAFYTRPQSAEILSVLAIDKPDEIVIDPACGSGTLLVSAYRRKAELAGKPTNELHEQFLEKDIFGIDIMPFAVHLTALNLTLQNLDADTDYTQTAVGDSLLELPISKLSKLGSLLPGLSDVMKHQSLDKTDSDAKISISPHTFDLVIMNPPFTKTERLPKDYSQKIKNNWKKWGGGVGLWGSFIGLACDYLVKEDGGKIAAVIPIAIFRGNETKLLRENLFSEKSKFRIKYVVKALKNLAFSESSAFRDILLVLERNTKIERSAFVFIKKDLKELSVNDAHRLGERIKAIPVGLDFEDNEFSISWVKWEDIVKDRRNLMPYVNIIKPNNRKILYEFFEQIRNHKQFELASEKLILEAWGPRPAGINKLVIVTRPTYDSRIERAFLVLIEDNLKSKTVKINVKGTDFTFDVPRDSLVPTLRTATSINKMYVSKEDMDYIITKPFKGFDFLKKLAGVKWEMDWERLNKELSKLSANGVLVNRMDIWSVNSNLISFSSDIKFYPTNQFKIINHINNKLFVLLFNSTLSLMQIIALREDTHRRFIHIHGHDISCLYLPNPDLLSPAQIDAINNLWDELKDKEFPSLLQQLNETNPYRLKLDRELFEILDIKFDIKSLYRAIAEEIERNVGVK